MNRMLLILLMLALSTFSIAQSVTTFILIRHAEKAGGSDDPDLLPAGEERAKRLAAMLQQVKVDAIYSTKYKRTKSTVTPLSVAQGLEIGVYEPFKNEPVDDMLRKHAGGTVVICGHSNNIPWIANYLTGGTSYKDYEESDYGNLLIIDVVNLNKTAKATSLRY